MKLALFENFFSISLLFIPPLLWLLGFFFSLRKRKKMKKILGERALAFLSSSLSLKKREWKRILECLVLLFFILAFFRPQWGKSTQKIKNHGIELIILFDVSKSMLAEDVLPNRLEFAKKEMSRFLEFSYGDKIGLVIFAGSAILISPMTTDYSALKMYIDSLTVDSVSRQGTDFQRALLEAKEAFKRGGVQETKNHVVTRALLIISDGEDNEKGALEMAQELKEEGMYIFSLLVGTKKGAPIRFRDSSGEVQGFQKDASGRIVLTQARETLLRKLASKGGGSFYHVVYGGKSIEKTREDIEILQKSEFKEAKQVRYKERYQLFLLFGFLIALIELFLSERSFRKKRWKGRFFVLFFLFFFLSHFSIRDFRFSTSKASLTMIYKNNQGVKALSKKNSKKARKYFLDGLEKEPFNPLLHFHLALTFEQEKEKEKAIQQYKTNLRILDQIDRYRKKSKKNFDEENNENTGKKTKEFQKEEKQNEKESLNLIRFKTLFNLARLLSEKEEIDQALMQYQKALDLRPNSQEIKTNIELLWKETSPQEQTKEDEQSQERKSSSNKDEKQKKKKEKKRKKNKNEKEEEKKNENSDEEKKKTEDSKELNEKEKEKKSDHKPENQNKKEKNKESAPSPRPFKGKDLTEEDVSRILEEIKNQEQKIRAKELSKKLKEKSHEKDW